MKSVVNKPKIGNLVDKKLVNIAFYSYNFNKIPPIIGVITADQFGNTIMIIEHDIEEKSNYRPIKTYLTGDDKKLIELDLVSMYFSSFKVFAGETNIQNLSHLEIYGSNIKVQLYFLFDKYMVIVFLNSNTQLNSKEKKEIVEYLKEKLTRYNNAFESFNEPNSRKILRMLELKGKNWLKKLNFKYMNVHNKDYIEKNEILDKFIEEIGPIIQTELYEYLPNIPKDIANDLSLEILNKIQDKLFNQIDLLQ